MQRTILKSALALGVVLGCGAVHATGGVFGLSGGANIWHSSPSGELFGLDVEDKDTLNLDSDSVAHVWAEWDHFLPLIPSVRFDRTQLTLDGESNSTIDLTHTDITAFWSPFFLLPYVSIDFGLTVRHFDGEIDGGDIGSSLPSEWQDEIGTATTFSGPLPMGFLRGSVSIPATPLRVSASIKTLSIGDHSVSDLQANLVYKLPFVGIMGGYRDFSVEFDEFDNVTADLSFSGPYAGVFARF